MPEIDVLSPAEYRSFSVLGRSHRRPFHFLWTVSRNFTSRRRSIFFRLLCPASKLLLKQLSFSEDIFLSPSIFFIRDFWTNNFPLIFHWSSPLTNTAALGWLNLFPLFGFLSSPYYYLI